MESSQQRGRMAGWSELFPEVLTEIAKRLVKRLDICQFRSVCKNWRSSLPLPQNPNLLNPILPFKSFISISDTFKGNYQLVATSVFLVQPLDSHPHSSPNGLILTLDERQPGKLCLLSPLSRNPIPAQQLPHSFPKSLDLSRFQVSEIAKGYKLESHNLNVSSLKVVLCSRPAQNHPDIADCTAIVLHSKGNWWGLWLGFGNSTTVVRHGSVWFRDVIFFKDKVLYGVADGGILYAIDQTTFDVSDAVVNCPVCQDYCLMKLVEFCGELYLVVVGKEFKVYKLNEMQNKWDGVNSLGDTILVVGFDYCFVIPSLGLLPHRGCFAVLSKRMTDESYVGLRLKWKEGAKFTGVYMECLLSGAGNCPELDSSYEMISSMLWPPPTWFCGDICPATGNFVVPSALRSAVQSFRAAVNYGRHGHQKGLQPAIPTEIPVNSSVLQGSKSGAITMKFEGVYIRFDLVLTLQKVWAKYGNIVEGSNVHSKHMLTFALESLAKVIIELQSNSGRTLTKSQCDAMNTILLDLKQLHLGVEWLVPFIEKATELHRLKVLTDAAREIDMAIAIAKGMKLRFAEFLDLDGVKKGLKENRRLVFEKISAVGAVDLDRCLAEGLF